MQLLGCLLTFALSAVLFVFMLGLHVLYRLRDFFFGPRTTQQRPRQQYSSQQQTRTSQPQPKKEKVIGDDEGEYVDFEEIKQ